jgi:hypothetical protein
MSLVSSAPLLTPGPSSDTYLSAMRHAFRVHLSFGFLGQVYCGAADFDYWHLLHPSEMSRSRDSVGRAELNQLSDVSNLHPRS